jgi:hypothetical protein
MKEITKWNKLTGEKNEEQYFCTEMEERRLNPMTWSRVSEKGAVDSRS